MLRLCCQHKMQHPLATQTMPLQDHALTEGLDKIDSCLDIKDTLFECLYGAARIFEIPLITITLRESVMSCQIKRQETDSCFQEGLRHNSQKLILVKITKASMNVNNSSGGPKSLVEDA